MLKANDPGGIQSISLTGEADWQCVNGDVAQRSDALYNPESATFQPSSNGQVDTYEFLSTNNDPGQWDCSPGFSFGTGSASLQGQATNFANKTAQATLSIDRNS